MSHSPIDRIPIRIEVDGFRPMDATLVRHLAPRTCDSILSSLPRESRGYLWQTSLVYFELPVSMGPEKARKFFKHGELLYWPLKGSVCIAIADGVPFSQVNQIGSMNDALPIMGELRAGTKVRISRRDV